MKEFTEKGPCPEGPNDFPKEPPIEEMPEDKIDNIYRRLAKIAGIDLEDTQDPISHVVRIGLLDRNPERILRNCAHLEVSVGSYGIPGKMLGLPTAGSKFLFCKYGGGYCGLSLDSLYNDFMKENCDACAHRHPMSEDWKWSIKWQQEKTNNRIREFQECLDRFAQDNY
jgi:hypothetical protein